VRTRVGYAGGRMENPTYRQMGDHTETLQLDYDASLISYGELLDIYWNSHDPYRRIMSRQYMNIIFVHNEEQERLARETLLERQQKGTVYTEIVPFAKFYLAEDYHQKYYLQGRFEFMQEFKLIYPEFQDFVDSTAVARVNGYIAGYGDATSLSRDLESLGLSTSSSETLKRVVR
jgi:peptide-methionine (S)-S-oxide reductase